MSSSRLVLLLALLVVLSAVSISEGLRLASRPKSCCFNFQRRPISAEKVLSYAPTSQQCSKAAILLKTVKGKHLCVNPTDPWVNALVKTLNANNPGDQSPL